MTVSIDCGVTYIVAGALVPERVHALDRRHAALLAKEGAHRFGALRFILDCSEEFRGRTVTRWGVFDRQHPTTALYVSATREAAEMWALSHG